MNDFTMTNTPSATNPSLVTLSAVSDTAKAMMADYFGNVVSLPFTQNNAAIFSETILRNGLSIGKIITVEQADQIILESKYADMIDDYEMVDGVHVYTLENGLAITVDENGIIRDFDNE